MKIVVCIKQVPDTTDVKINPQTGTIIREGIPSIMNPDDKGGLELALRLKDEFGAHVTVITMGPPQADAVLREAYAMGVDRAILLTDRAFAGADTLATSHALAFALNCIEHDLIITGRQAIDGDTAQVGPQIAEHLKLAQISYVADARFDGKDKFTVKKELEDGYQMLEVYTPCLFTVLASAIKPRYMSVRGICEAFDKEVEIWTVANINADPEKLGGKGSPTRVKKSFAKALKQPGEVKEGTPEELVDIIVAKLKEKFII
ncbi:MAG: electron transfer flavoprotein subunit beta/FixA family protein [bacterium]|nr:electron transfer flavoprotein subunit beta/FixA family protein [Candidatus Colousia faecequi]